MDVLQLRDFYATPLGHAARHLIAHRLRQCARPPADARVMGLGFAAPWLDAYRRRCRDVFSFMPARQGIIHWPARGHSASALVDETALPLTDSAIDMALVVHGLELAENLNAMLAEVWRVLAPQGHLVVVVPNRRGMWARRDTTPFGHGRPFSRGQLERLLTEAGFELVNVMPALFMPPVQRRLFLHSAMMWERAGLALWQGFSGLIVAEAVKRVHALRGRRARRFAIPDLAPLPSPSPALNGLRKG
jgi:SAM-dependent methyltransferase